MTTVADNQDALNLRDRWPRGVNYTRYLTLRDSAGAAIALTGFPELAIEVQGPNDSDPLGGVFSATYDDERGGAASGAISVFIDSTVMETGWPDSGAAYANTINWTVKGSPAVGDPNERPIFNATVTVYDTAFG